MLSTFKKLTVVAGLLAVTATAGWAQSSTVGENAALPPARGASTTGTPSNQPQPLDSLSGMNADYQIGPNDLIDVDVYGVPELKRTVRVNSSGAVSLPLVDRVSLLGLTGQQAEERIAAAYSEKYLQNPQVSVFIKEFTTRRVTIEGAVEKPGIYPVTGQLTLLRALALAGGGAKYADLSEINVFRMGPNRQPVPLQTFDLDAIREGKEPDPFVLPDDVIVVKRSAARTALRDSLFRDILDSINPFSSVVSP